MTEIRRKMIIDYIDSNTQLELIVSTTEEEEQIDGNWTRNVTTGRNDGKNLFKFLTNLPA